VDRTEKREFVTGLHQALAATSMIVVTRNAGLTVAEVSDLRRKMGAAGATYKVAKNRLTNIALDGTQFGSLNRSTPPATPQRPTSTRTGTEQFATRAENAASTPRSSSTAGWIPRTRPRRSSITVLASSCAWLRRDRADAGSRSHRGASPPRAAAQ